MRIRASAAIREFLASQITSRFTHIGHAAAEGSGPPSYRRAHLFSSLLSTAPHMEYGKNAHFCDPGKGNFWPFVNV
jgi:hypothetical protein